MIYYDHLLKVIIFVHWAAITKYRRLSGLETTEPCFSQFQRLGV